MRTWMSTTGKVALASSASALASLALAGGASASSVSCDLVAAPNGSDAAPGTVDQPLGSAQALADRLRTGQAGCLRDGTYTEHDDEVSVDTPGVTLTSYPGERATILARVWVTKRGDDVTIENLDLNGRTSDVPSPTINASDVTLRGNDITNDHTNICVSLGSPHTWGRAERTLIVDNRIHDCGRLPATNQDHGIYVNSSDDAVIRDNWIYDNADRGIQLYSDAQGTLVTGNVIDRNGEGIIFGGDSDSASSGNVVKNNIVTNSKERDNIDSFWDNQVGKDNVVRDNCLGGGSYDTGDGGIKDGEPGFSATRNLVKVPDFAGNGDYSLPASNPCAAILRGADGGTSGGPAGPGPDGPHGVVTIDTTKTQVAPMTPVKIRGRAKGAHSVRILARRDGGWHQIKFDRTHRKGHYRTVIRIRSAGRQTLKAVAGGLRDSKPVRLRVKKQQHHRAH